MNNKYVIGIGIAFAFLLVLAPTFVYAHGMTNYDSYGTQGNSAGRGYHMIGERDYPEMISHMDQMHDWCWETSTNFIFQ